MTGPDLPQRSRKPPTFFYHAVAVLSVAVAIVATELVTRLLHAEAVASSMLCAVIFAAWLGGFGPGVLATTLALLAFHYYMVPPVNSFGWKHDLFAVDISELPRLILFSMTSLFVTFMISAQRRATAILRRSRDDLQAAIEDQKRIRAALVRSELYLAETQHLSHTSSWAWDVRRREFVYRSAEVYHLFGLDPERDAGRLRPFRERIAPEDRLRVIEVAQRAIREKSDFEVDFRIVLPDGSVKRVHSVGHPVVNNAGDVIELVGTHVDVTEQYDAKEKLQAAFDELKKSEDRLRLVIDTIPTLVWRAGPEGIPDFLNQPALDYTGLSLDQAETGWPRAFHPDDKKGMLTEVERNTGVRHARRARSSAPALRWRVSLVFVRGRAAARRGGQHRQMVRVIYRHRGPQADRGKVTRAVKPKLAEAQRASQTGSFVWNLFTGERFGSRDSSESSDLTIRVPSLSKCFFNVLIRKIVRV